LNKNLVLQQTIFRKEENGNGSFAMLASEELLNQGLKYRLDLRLVNKPTNSETQLTAKNVKIRCVTTPEPNTGITYTQLYSNATYTHKITQINFPLGPLVDTGRLPVTELKGPSLQKPLLTKGITLRPGGCSPVFSVFFLVIYDPNDALEAIEFGDWIISHPIVQVGVYAEIVPELGAWKFVYGNF
jgi:hypothetical protein